MGRQMGLSGQSRVWRAVMLVCGLAWLGPVSGLKADALNPPSHAATEQPARPSGFAPEDLRSVIVHDPARGEDDAIAAAKLGGRWLTLDNRRMAMVWDVDARNYRPIFVIDRDGVRRYEAPPLLAGTPARSPA